MTISTMNYFIVLARERNFTRAAQQLHITQQSLSSHIAAVEQELGAPLFIRRTPLQLTYAGTVFLRYATKIQQELDDLHREFCDITENQKGVLRVGVAYTRGRALTPRIIKHFQQQYPHIEVELAEDTNDGLHKNLLNGALDLAIANFPNALQGVELHDFYSEEVVLLISKPLFERLYPFDTTNMEQQISVGNLSSLSQCPFALNSPVDIAGQIERRILKSAGIQPVVVARSNNSETLMSLCVEGVCASFCPENLVKNALSQEQLDTLKIFHLGKQAQYPIRFGYLKNAYQWTIVSEFMRLAAETLK